MAAMPVRSRERGTLTGAQRGAATASSLRQARTLTQEARGTVIESGSKRPSRDEPSWVSRAGREVVRSAAGVVATGARGAVQVADGARRFGTQQARDAVETAGQVDVEQGIRGAVHSGARTLGARLPGARGRLGRLGTGVEAKAQGVVQSMPGDVDASYEAGRRTERVLIQRGAKPAGRLTANVVKRGARVTARGAMRAGRRATGMAAHGASRVGQAVSNASKVTARVLVRAAVAVKAVMVSTVGSSPMLAGAALVLVLVMLMASILPPWLSGVQEEYNANSADSAAGVVCSRSQYGLGPVKPHVEQAANLLGSMFGVATIGGYRPGNTYDYSGHPAGLAIDLMVPISDAGKQQGQQIADYSQAHAAALGIKYVIWYQKIWSVERASEGWRAMEDRGSPTQNHVDHVHISFNQQPGNGDLASMLNEACGNPTNDAGGGVDSAAPVRGGWTYPSPSRSVSSPFGMRTHPVTGVHKLHTGTDYRAACGTPIYAAAAGTVSSVGWNRAYGMLITVNHGGNVVTRYAHSERGNVMVKPGQQVRAGQQISKVGNAGFSTGCHLHFEVRLGGEFVDPAAWLRKQGV